MKRSFLLFLAAGLAYCGFAQTFYKMPKGLDPSDYMAKTVILKVKENYRSFCSEQGIALPALQKSITNIGGATLTKKFKNEQPPREKYNREGLALADLSLLYELKYSSSYPLEKVINALLASGTLVYAEPHF